MIQVESETVSMGHGRVNYSMNNRGKIYHMDPPSDFHADAEKVFKTKDFFTGMQNGDTFL